MFKSNDDYVDEKKTNNNKKDQHTQRKDGDVVDIEGIGPNDVLLGRGAQVNRFCGNVHFRTLIKENVREYASTKKRQFKDEIARKIVKSIKGRFLKRQTKDGEDDKGALDSSSNSSNFFKWIVIGEAEAVEKTKQALRDLECTNKRKLRLQLTEDDDDDSQTSSSNNVDNNNNNMIQSSNKKKKRPKLSTMASSALSPTAAAAGVDLSVRTTTTSTGEEKDANKNNTSHNQSVQDQIRAGSNQNDTCTNATDALNKLQHLLQASRNNNIPSLASVSPSYLQSLLLLQSSTPTSASSRSLPPNGSALLQHYLELQQLQQQQQQQQEMAALISLLQQQPPPPPPPPRSDVLTAVANSLLPINSYYNSSLNQTSFLAAMTNNANTNDLVPSALDNLLGSSTNPLFPNSISSNNNNNNINFGQQQQQEQQQQQQQHQELRYRLLAALATAGAGNSNTITGVNSSSNYNNNNQRDAV